MANNTKIPFVQLSDTINTHRKRFNQLVDSVGDITSLTTDAVDVVQSINELDAKLDSIQNTGLWTPGAHFSDSNFVSHFDGQLNVDTRLWTSNLEADSAYVGQLNASQVDIDSAYVDVLDVHFLHADSAYIDGDLSVKGNLIVDGVSSLKAGNASLVTIGDTNTDAVVFQAQVGSAIIPNNTHDLGGQTDKWGTLWVENASIDSAAINQLDVDSADIRQLRIRDGIIDSAYVTQLNVATMDADNAVLDSAYIGQLNVSQADIDSAYADQINVSQFDADSAYIDHLNVSQLEVDSAYFYQINVNQIAGDSAYFSQLNFKDVDVDSAFINKLNVEEADIDAGTFGQITIDSAYATQINVSQLDGDSAHFDQLNVRTADIDTLTSANTILDSAYIGQLNSANADIDSAHISQLHVDSADFGTLSTSGFIGVIDSAAASNMHVNILSVNTLSAATQVVEGNVRVGDAYVVLLSENTPDQGVPTQNAGIAVRRRAYDSAVIEWNEAGNYWVANYDSSNTSQILTASNIDGTTLEFTSGTVNVKDNGIALGTKTTGNYVQSVGVTASTGISASGTGEGATVTIAGVNATTSVKGVASFSSDNFSVSNGAVSIKNNGVALGTETTGNYMSGISGTTNEISVTHTPSEGSTATIGLPDDVTITDQLSVNRIAVTKGITADSADISQFAADSANVSGSLWVGGNTILKGNLTVSGTTTTVNTETINLADNIIVLNSNLGSGTGPTQDGGIEIERGNRNNARLVWDESENYWAVHDDSAATKTGTLSRIATSSWLDATAPISFNSTFGSITHDASGVTAATYGQSGTEDGSYIKSVTVNATGHITAITADDFDNRYDNYGSWTAKDDDGTTYTITSGDILTFDEGTDIDVNFTADDVLTFSHKNVTKASLSGSTTLLHGNSFSVVDSIQTSATGHVTSVGTRTFTLPDLDSATLRDYYFEPILPVTTLDAIRVNGNVTGLNDYVGNIQSSTNEFYFSWTSQNSTQRPCVVNLINPDTSLSDAAEVARINFTGENSGNGLTAYASLVGSTLDVTGSTEDGKLDFNIIDDGTEYTPLTLSSNVEINANYTAMVAADKDVYFRSDGSAVYINDANPRFNFKGRSTYSGTPADPVIDIENRNLNPVDFEGVGTIRFLAENSASAKRAYGTIEVFANDVSNLTEDGQINLKKYSGGSEINVFEAGTNTTVRSNGDVLLIAAGDDIFFQGNTSGEQIKFDLDTTEQTITASDSLKLTSGNFTTVAATNSVLLEPGDGKVIFQSTAQQGFLDFATSSTIKLYTGTTSGTLNSTWNGDDLTVQGDITSVSDVRTKENVETVENGLDLVSQLRGVWYNKIGKDERKVGVIAQEVEEVLPEVVLTDTEGMKAVDYGKMVGVLIEAIKDLKSEVDMLKHKLGE